MFALHERILRQLVTSDCRARGTLHIVMAFLGKKTCLGLKMQSNICTKCLQHPEGSVLLKLCKRSCVSQMFTAASFQSCECLGAPCWESCHALCHRAAPVCWKVWAPPRANRIHDSVSDSASICNKLHPVAFTPDLRLEKLHSCTVQGCRGLRRGESHEIMTTWTGSCVPANI